MLGMKRVSLKPTGGQALYTGIFARFLCSFLVICMGFKGSQQSDHVRSLTFMFTLSYTPFHFLIVKIIILGRSSVMSFSSAVVSCWIGTKSPTVV